jgi:hypothetical protein
MVFNIYNHCVLICGMMVCNIYYYSDVQYINCPKSEALIYWLDES